MEKIVDIRIATLVGHKRWKRLDYVRTHYDINSLEEFTTENIINYIKKIGLRNKKNLIVWQCREWQNISRVYFTIEGEKITEQWNTKKQDDGQMTIFDLGDK